MNQTLNYVPARKILSPEELNCVTQATQFQGESRRILGSIQEDLAQQMETSRREGFSEGYSEGVTSAMADLNTAVENVRASLMGAEHDLASIVLSAVEKVIGSLEPADLVLRAVRQALTEAADAVWVTVRTSPEDYPALSANMERITQSVPGVMVRGIESDPLLRPGELLLETPKGRVHIGLRQQLARLQTGLSRISVD